MFECNSCGTTCAGASWRKFCSNACQRDGERRGLVARWLETGEAPYVGSRRHHYVRRYIADEQGHVCALCELPDSWQDAPLVFVLDHIDGDPTNNDRDNLRLICPNCDSQLPTYKSRNRGRGRHARRERYANGQSF